MGTTRRQSGRLLALAGIAGVLFFVLTDPRLGIIHRWTASEKSNIVDAANQALAGTVVGIAGSLIVLGIGVWLLTRRTP